MPRVDYPTRYELLARDFGVEAVLEQNDIEPELVIEMLHKAGLIDLEDYFFSEMENVED